VALIYECRLCIIEFNRICAILSNFAVNYARKMYSLAASTISTGISFCKMDLSDKNLQYSSNTAVQVYIA